jgi:CRISPR-associated protein Cas2
MGFSINLRIIVMLNPSNKYGTKSAYTELRKFLIKYGYLLLQPEVFMRVENTKKNCIKHQNRIKEFLPKT